MINILSYIGMSLQSEVCLWTLLGLVRTIFDATLFKVNANLKQVWHMSMPEELSLPVQRVLRTMISGIMLVQCFTVYVYLASYIVLLYPVFLEERPTLVLPWLLLAAIRKLLCELTSLALGLGTCVLLGPARTPCIKFVVMKVISIMPSFYMWMLLYTYYHVLKLASVFKTFPAVLPASEHDYGLELAVRRRRTKSLLGEDQLRRKLMANLYNEHPDIGHAEITKQKPGYSLRMTHATDTSNEDINIKEDSNALQPLSVTSNRMISESGCYEDWFGSEILVPRDTDRITEQFVLMMLRIGAYLLKQGVDPTNSQLFNSEPMAAEYKREKLHAAPMAPDETDTPPLVGSSRGKTASYLRDYPQIFNKRPSDIPLRSDVTLNLTSDDRVGLSHKSKDQGGFDEAHRIENQNTSNVSKEISFKKLQTLQSDRSVTFQPKNNGPTLRNAHSISLFDGPDRPNTENPKEGVDSLDSIIESIRLRGSVKEGSLKKDENYNSTQNRSSNKSQNDQDVRTETSQLSIMKSENQSNVSDKSTTIKPTREKRQNRDSKKKRH